jgi:hypothetical protein
MILALSIICAILYIGGYSMAYELIGYATFGQAPKYLMIPVALLWPIIGIAAVAVNISNMVRKALR